jgi:hypothetical protein
MKIYQIIAISSLLTIAATSVAKADEAPWVIGIDQLHRIDLLPAFKRTIKIGAVTSYDRTEGNDDGFSGKYSFVRKEGNDLVLAEIKGPGCIYRIHTPSPTDDPLEFYFDDEATPRLKTTFRKLYLENKAPFLRPLVDVAGGGYYCYVPLQFKKSIKIVLRAPSFQFYDLNYALYPEDAPITTFDPNKSESANIAKVSALFNNDRSKDLTAFNVPSGTKTKKIVFEKSLVAGKTITLFQTQTPGRIAGFRIGPSDAFTSKNRDILLRITWDGDKKPAVLCPIGDFFGYAWGKPATGSTLVGTYAGENYCNLPMPFDRSAKIELVSLRESGAATLVRGEVILGDTPRKAYEGKFYAEWHRENPTTEGKPFTFLETTGRGHVVGLALQSQGTQPGNTGFFEGDDKTTIDGELVVHGTGSEDFFNGGWYEVPGRWDAPVARALSGCMLYQKALARTGAYRFFIGDCYSYRRSIIQTIEHAPEKNEMVTDYCGVTYFYSEKQPDRPIADLSLPKRRIVDPTTIVFSAHWTLPIGSFCLNSAKLSRKNVPADGGEVRCLSLEPIGGDFFGPPFISFICNVPETAKYKVYADVVKGPSQGIVQLFRDEYPQGDRVDLFSTKPTVVNRVYFGEISAIEGNNDLMFKIVDKNAMSKELGFDLINIVFVKTP